MIQKLRGGGGRNDEKRKEPSKVREGDMLCTRATNGPVAQWKDMSVGDY